MSCFPGLLDRLGPHILRSHITNAQFKPIPNNERVDLLRFRVKESQEWGADDVVAWMLDVARRHQIPCENLNMHKFAKCTGPLLMLMTEQNFKECDPCYGSLLFSEFRKLLPEDTVIDDWIRSYKTGGNGCTEVDNRSALTNNNNNNNNSTRTEATAVASMLAAPQMQLKTEPLENISQQQSRFPAHQMQSPAQQPQQQHQQHQANINGFLAAAVAAASVRPQLGLIGEMNQQMAHLQQQQQRQQQNQAIQLQQAQQQHQQNVMSMQGSSATAAACQQLLNNSTAALNQQFGGINSAQKMAAEQMKRVDFESKASTSANDALYNASNLRLKIRKNKDGRPRKRSQHTKGNKLWEFIRDALKDASTCPSVVRWEDPVEGVFRIVESEKLARLWGDKKNNQKMTYEKLSRAMRTYYEKQILVPVPKTGLYPKKLVYKFGPSAHGWSAPPHLVIASSSLLMEQL